MDAQIIAGIAAILLAVASLIAAVASRIKSSGEVAAVRQEREETKHERDTAIALLKQRCKFLEDRLDEGNDRFGRLELEMKSMNEKFDGKMLVMNDKLVAVITKLDTIISMQKKSHVPEGRPL